jgi:NarL family two-component system response regulator LiaR
LIQESLDAGAVGYLVKNAPADRLADAIRSAYAGEPALAPEATQSLIRARIGPQKLGPDLSKREKEVLALVVEGLSNDEIAERLVISPATARHHVSACLTKLGASNRTHAAALAVKHRIND